MGRAVSDEYYDEVTKNDVPTGRKLTREQIHASERPPHRCVAVFVFDGSGDLYVQVHKISGGLLDHTVGGHVDSGEDYKTAAYREMDEEIGLSGVELDELAVGYYSDEGSRVHVFGIYACVAPESWSFEPNEEVAELKKMSISTIQNMMDESPELFTGGFINTMKKYKEVR